MKKTGKAPRRTAVFLIAAVLLLASGGVMGTRAALNIQSDYYRAQFYLNHLQVHLYENGEDVCKRAGHENDLDGESKTTGELATKLGYKNPANGEETLGSVEPGRMYDEVIQAGNGSDIDEFVRLTIRKYWMEPVNGDSENPSYVKSGTLSPRRIKLSYKGKAYNDSDWVINPSETTAESATYYYRTDLSAGELSEPLFDELMIDAELADLGEVTVTEAENGGKTIYTYEYQYDGAVFYIEADVQAIQTHNVNDAIRSQWGVTNVTATYSDDGQSGTLTVGAAN